MRGDEARDLADLSKEMNVPGADGELPSRLCKLATQHVAGCDHASITLRTRGGRFTTLAVSAPAAEELDAEQYRLDEGPCVDAARDGMVHHENRLETTTQWVAWAPIALRAGCRSVLAVPLVDHVGDNMGAINFYSERHDVWDAEARDHAYLFSTHAALALDAANVVSGLRTALTSRHQIGVAQGILMERYQMGLDQSFDVLRRYSQDLNIKVSRLAEDIVGGRSLDELGIDPRA